MEREMPELDDIPDYKLLDAVAALVKVYADMGRQDDCIRLTVDQARRLEELARGGYYGN